MSNRFSKIAKPSITNLQPYQPGKPISEVKRELGLRNVIKLASNENPLGASPQAIEAAIDASKRCHLYPNGCAHDLREVMAEHLDVQPSQLTFGTGSDNVLALLVQAFTLADSEIVISEYAFSTYYILCCAHGAKPVIAPSTNWGHDLEAMHAAITEKTSLVFIANPNNPTATWVDHTELCCFLQQVPEHVVVVIDEAYIEYMNDPNYPDTLALMSDYPNLVVTRTFSKIHGLAGLRVGYGISHPDIADLLNRIRLPFNVPNPAQAAAIAAIKADDHIQASQENNSAGRERLIAECAEHCLDYLCDGGNFITVNFGSNAEAIFNGLLQHGIITRPLLPYHMPNHLRITIGTPHEIEKLAKVLPQFLD